MKNCLKYCCPFLLITMLHSLSAYAQTTVVKTANQSVPAFTSKFGYGSNMIGQSNGWTDQTVAGIINKAGGTTLRTTLPDNFIQTWGINVRVSAFNTYTGTLGMKDLVCFIEGPSTTHQDQTVYPGNTSPSKLFANLYTPTWNADGSINQNNYYANYVYGLVQTYGSYIRFWEVVNEPDYTYNADVSQWLTRAPLPSETPNTLAPFYYYIRMLRITWEVVKKYYPNSYVTTGGIGYDTYLDALLRYTDNPADGSVTTQYPNKGGAYFDVLSYHTYPSYSLRYWDNSIGNFRYTQNSDFAAAQVITNKVKMNTVLQKYGYNGSTYPKKYFIVTETNISRRTSDWRYSSDEMQRNFGMKTLVLAQKNDIKQIHIYGAGESINAPAAGTSVSSPDENKLMGLYENLQRDAPGNEKLTQLGVGYSTTSKLLNGYSFDTTRTAALNLPSAVEGGAFVNNGNYVYALWAKDPTDKTETYSVNYSFPASLNISSFDRFEWNYSSTATSTKQTSQGIVLNTSPSFFKVSATASAPPPVTGTPVYRINAGGAQLTNSIGTFAADAYYSPAPGNTSSSSAAINGTSNGAIYQSERYGTNGTFSYAFPVNNGNYNVVLHFAEFYWSAAKQRVFSVRMEGNKVLDKYDIFQDVGGFTAISKTFVVNVTDGVLNIDFSSLPIDGGVDQPKVSAIEVLTSSGTTPPAPVTVASPAGSPVYRTNAGGGQVTNSIGTFAADAYYSPSPGYTSSTPAIINGTANGAMYQTERYGTNGTFSYAYPVTNGSYTVVLHFAEFYWTAAGKRVFSVKMEGNKVLDKYDIFQSAGAFTATSKTFTVNVTDGVLNIDFSSLPADGGVDQPKVSAIEVLSNGGTAATARMASVPSTTNSRLSKSNLSDELISYPNPFTNTATVQFNLAISGVATIEVFDMKNSLIKRLFSGFLEAGITKKLTLSSYGLSPGVYIVRLTTGAKVLTKSVVMIR